ncbi:hypothetical protein PMAYCL1PPCAC_02611, partial [Pristionchus mayeri]
MGEGGGDFQSFVHLPSLLVVIDGDSSRTVRDHEKKTTNDRHRLKEVVLHEVAVETVRGHSPPRVDPQIESEQPDDESEGRQLRLVPNRHQHNQCSSHHEFDHLKEGHLEVDEREKHEDEEDATGEEHVRLGFVLVSHGGHSCEERLLLLEGLCEEEKQTSSHSDVPGEELHVPEDVVGDGLEEDDESKESTRNRHLQREHDHDDGHELAEEVVDDEARSEEVTTTPRFLHELSLVIPLIPHSDSIFDERRHEAESSDVREVVTSVAHDIIRHVLGLSEQSILGSRRPELVHHWRTITCREG